MQIKPLGLGRFPPIRDTLGHPMCGIVALLLADSDGHANQDLYNALTALQHRGQGETLLCVPEVVVDFLETTCVLHILLSTILVLQTQTDDWLQSCTMSLLQHDFGSAQSCSQMKL